MINTIDMQDMRHLNLFNQISRVRTRFCFKYNNTLIFCVPHLMLQKAIGENGRNVKKIKEILKINVKIIPSPRGVQDARRFIESVVNPVRFNEMEISGDEMIINAGKQNKASLIGRDRRRFFELQKVVSGFFEKDLKII